MNNSMSDSGKVAAESSEGSQLHFPQGDYSITVEEDLVDDEQNIPTASTSIISNQAAHASHASSLSASNNSGSIIHNQSLNIQQQLQQQQLQQKILQQQQQQRQQLALNASLEFTNSSFHLPNTNVVNQPVGLNDSITFPSVTAPTQQHQQQSGGALYESVDFPIASSQITNTNVAVGSGGRNSIAMGQTSALYDSVDFPIVQGQTSPANASGGALYESVDFPLAQQQVVHNVIGMTQQQHQQQQYQQKQNALYDSIDLADPRVNINPFSASLVTIPNTEIETLDADDICMNDDDDIDEEAITKYLKNLEFPTGLIEHIISNRRGTAKHYWVIDNSGSMLQNDGLRLATKKGNPPVVVPCTRWKELQQSVVHHTEMAGNLGYVTQFMLLNIPGMGVTQRKFTVGTSEETLQDDIKVAKKLLQTQPDGVSLITKGLRSLQSELHALAPVVSEQGKKIYFVLATDGLPSDKFGQTNAAATEQLMETLRDFESYPIFFVIRLCSNDEETVQFYNGLDALLERNIEVIQDIHTEASEIFKINKWINYSLPLHWSREMGLRDRLFDLIDERQLTKEEMINFLRVLFGKAIDDLPDALYDWKAFHSALTNVVKNEGFTWDPVSRKLKYWIDLKALDKIYGDGGQNGTRSNSLVGGGGGSTATKSEGGGCGCSIS